MYQRGFVGSDFQIEDTDEFVFEDEVMMGLGGDFDFSDLGQSERGDDDDEKQ